MGLGSYTLTEVNDHQDNRDKKTTHSGCALLGDTDWRACLATLKNRT